MDSVIRGDGFHTWTNRSLPRMRFGNDSFSKEPGSKSKNESAGIKWRCSDCGCAGFQSGCLVVVTRDGNQRGSVCFYDWPLWLLLVIKNLSSFFRSLPW